MVEADITMILAIVGAIISPLIVAITVLWKQLNKDRKFYAIDRKEMQDKIEHSQRAAIDAINSMSSALNGLSHALASLKEEFQEESKKWETLRINVITSMKKGKK